MMIVRRHTLYLGVLSCAAFLFAGCTPVAQSPSQKPPEALASPQVDIQTGPDAQSKPPTTHPTTGPLRISSESCEMRLQDLCGPLLEYLAIYHKFPDQIEDLRQLPDLDKAADFTCPVTHEPYVYVQNGIPMSDHKGGVLLYDRDPHNGVRWAIEMIWTPGAPAPLALVIPMTEEAFRSLKTTP
jgi:hypothetical protein